MMIDRQRATMLAALRYWQRQGPLAADDASGSLTADERQALCDVATDGGQFTHLSASEIDWLCELLNEGHGSESDESICECQLPGYFCSGVPGILAHVVQGRLPPEANIERCDLCQRYPNDEAARAQLRELGFVPAVAPVAPAAPHL